MKTMSVGMGLETRVHCLNGVICQTRVVVVGGVTITKLHHYEKVRFEKSFYIFLKITHYCYYIKPI
jgi:hypothetical protein